MANEEHLAQLKQGVEAWNAWRLTNPRIQLNLSEADLSKADLSRSGPQGGAPLLGAPLRGAPQGGKPQGGTPHRSGSHRGGSSREPACYGQTSRAQNLTGCLVYGVSAWDLNLAGTKQLNLVITERDEPVITVDNLEVAQFIYLLLHNEKIREVIDTITSKAVLILGRFTPDRKVVLDAIRESLRQRNYLPILFDFEKPASRDLTETISTLAHIARSSLPISLRQKYPARIAANYP